MPRQMIQTDPVGYRTCDEIRIVEELVEVAGRQVLELGCGAAWMTRLLATHLGARRVTATEVDRIQHAKNLAVQDLPTVEFRFGGAESIDDADATYDGVFLFKSLHHVPVEFMDRALAEIRRVLAPGGYVYVSEPVYWGAFNAVMRLIHDERLVRTAAYAAIERAVDSGRFAWERQVFYQSEGVYPNWDAFAERFIQVTHTERDLDAARLAEIRAAFERHLTPEGARFLKPHRVDLLRAVV
ncbi:class I SAM-dependent methyltransferase [Allochromatium vinosum]|uniref:Methyltransferase type 11 n=1 Tax=Allochromatium vinosum (strain ATCC 17899 / DSM 180 / NBRC 103801 / NCIMB 10441 / D) TaxID=572477 RepID=D3RQA5_ALLVD|nr:class I SAM-dependent methyltransferase [Allochromatium vinosum]ADC61710.1 Methyltransferase type 11 [Allochromatium vinosum DSM 180]